MDGWMVQHFSTQHSHTQTHNGARITRELFASSSGTDLDGGLGRDEPSPRRCDAMPMRHAGATRYFAFYGVHSGIGTGYPHSGCFCFSGRFFLFLSDCPFWANQKRARTSITCIFFTIIIINIIIIPERDRKGGGAGEGRSNLCLFLVTHLGNIGELFSSLAKAGFPLSQPCLLCF